jgi:2-iminobutanoate/2-iminopropanoate deaminase
LHQRSVRFRYMVPRFGHACIAPRAVRVRGRRRPGDLRLCLKAEGCIGRLVGIRSTRRGGSVKKKAVFPKGGPQPKGPYSPAIVFGDLVFVSGMGSVDPATGNVVPGDTVQQLDVTARNIRAILEAAGSGMDKILKVNVYLADMNDFQRMNEAYREHFGPVLPARTTIQAGRLPLDLKIEIEVVAHR